MYAIYSLANAAWVLDWWKILTLCKVDFCLGYRTSGRGVCLFSLIFKLLDKSMSFFLSIKGVAFLLLKNIQLKKMRIFPMAAIKTIALVKKSYFNVNLTGLKICSHCYVGILC